MTVRETKTEIQWQRQMCRRSHAPELIGSALLRATQVIVAKQKGLLLPKLIKEIVHSQIKTVIIYFLQLNATGCFKRMFVFSFQFSFTFTHIRVLHRSCSVKFGHSFGHLFLWWKIWKVFRVTWYFRNDYIMLIWCSRSIVNIENSCSALKG